MIIRRTILLFTILAFFVNLKADFKEGKVLFEDKCASCHEEYISFKKLKENFFERNNTLLNLTIPTQNMLAWAIMESSKKIGDPSDPEMRIVEIEEYLKEYLANPDINNTVCDNHIVKYYKEKEPMDITEDEATLLAEFFMGYKEDRLKRFPKPVKVLKDNNNDDKIIKEALEKNKQIIVFATAQSCYFCKKMKHDVLDLTEVQEAIGEDYIFVEVDVDFISLPFGLNKRFKGMTPTFFILTSAGQLINTYPGAWDRKDFLGILKENL